MDEKVEEYKHIEAPGLEGAHNSREEKVGSDATTSELGADSEYHYPEGGFWGWAAVAGAVLLQISGFGYCNAYGVFQDYYTRIYLTNASPSAISWIGGVNAFLAIASSLFTGILYDMGYLYHMLYSGSILAVFSLFMLSLAKPGQLYQIFLAQGVGFGLASGLLYLPSVAIVSQYFDRWQPLAMLVVVSGGAIGAIVHPILVNQLLKSGLGFGNTVRVSGGVASVLLLVACCFIKSRGLPPGRPPNMKRVVASSMRDGPYVCLCISLVASAAGLYYPAFYLQLSAIEHGLNENFSFYIFTIMNSCCLIGGLLPALYVDSLGVINMMIGSSAIMSASVFAMAGLQNVASAVVITVVFGLSLGTAFGLQAPVITQLTHDKSELGARLGIAFTFFAAGSLAGPPIHGALLSSNFIWWKPAIFSGICTTLGTIGFGFIPWLVKRARNANGAASLDAIDAS